MDIFYINIKEFKQKHDKDFLSKYCDKEFKNEKRFYEYSIGRYLVKNVAKKFYNISDCEIITNENGKPFFKNSDLHFSISHSKDYLVACFDKNICGIDIEFIKERNLKYFEKYYNRSFKNCNEFYRFWTQKEASYKLSGEVKGFYTTIFNNDYYLTVTSSTKTDNIKITEFRIC